MSSYEVDRVYEIILSVELSQNDKKTLNHYRIHVSQQGLQGIQKIRTLPNQTVQNNGIPTKQNQINQIEHEQSIS